METERYLEEAERYSAHNYHPLPVVLTRGEGIWVWDVEGNRYLDMLSAYSAVNQGHAHPRIVQALIDQAKRLPLTSRAFHNDRMGPFLKRLCELSGYEKALPMNTGAEAVETAIKAVRKWGYEVKGVPADRAEILVFAGNFHGRTTTVISFSSEELYKQGFGPLTPGFRILPYGDLDAVRAAMTERTVGILVEPIQGEAGVVVPPEGFLRGLRELCDEHGAALIADEIQTGLGRTGRLFASEWEGVRPDVMIVGKALGGGVYPVSAILADGEIMDVFTPGTHGSTFGGNPTGAAVGLAALDVIMEEKLAERADELGRWFMDRLRAIESPVIREVRGRGLMIGVVLTGPARPYCEALQERGMLAKETHENVVRFAPPLVIEKAELEAVLPAIREVLSQDLAATPA
ncbi:MAG: ornithine--oxo-acid transaminase [Gemmatimonadetes bacterium]|nr:ornithine--oxo-acid transaminase [Gemmatimonadota bacterium]NIU75703.1 ornithine--oxo-acid transaminase [Gammaproteobacteria bacterium]NIQ55493.1 ornithine--oxo-acid transaminase [Gemmatimonadota bacterium]NIW37800.1 ornithine--oxo-acid transaminase [Gemmatimonadota bacterium]NIX46138.1 ornithine--oxo-acid transaminase [Gemmatimonadota bacterium]